MWSVLKRTALLGGLATIVCGLLLLMLVGPHPFAELAGIGLRPRFVQDWPPPTDLPQLPGYRSVWAEHPSAAAHVRPGDRLLEVVAAAPEPFAPHHQEPLIAVALVTRRALAAVVITLAPDGGPGDHATDLRFTSATTARVDDVLFNHGEGPLKPGAIINVAPYGGTRVSHVGETQVVERVSYVRAPRANTRYLLFVGIRGYDGIPPAFAYGNAFEIRGNRVANMSLPDAGAWRHTSSLPRVLALVRRRAELPMLRPGEFETLEELRR